MRVSCCDHRPVQGAVTAMAPLRNVCACACACNTWAPDAHIGLLSGLFSLSRDAPSGTSESINQTHLSGLGPQLCGRTAGSSVCESPPSSDPVIRGPSDLTIRRSGDSAIQSTERLHPGPLKNTRLTKQSSLCAQECHSGSQ